MKKLKTVMVSAAAMVDIDNLSNSNMSRFVDQFAPLILYTVSKMDQQLTFNPYTGIDEQYDFTAITLPLTIFTSMAPPVQETRLERFAKIQARVELPVRIFAVTNEYRILYALDSRVNDAKNYLDRLKDALEDATGTQGISPGISGASFYHLWQF